jgi:hypothetical protein
MTMQLFNTTAEIKHPIETREASIGIVGMGYVCLPLVLMFSEERFSITGFDIDSSKVAALNRGGLYIVGISGVEIQPTQKNGFTATADYGEGSASGPRTPAFPSEAGDCRPRLRFRRFTDGIPQGGNRADFSVPKKHP